jgi:hypothetical protein
VATAQKAGLGRCVPVPDELPDEPCAADRVHDSHAGHVSPATAPTSLSYPDAGRLVPPTTSSSVTPGPEGIRCFHLIPSEVFLSRNYFLNLCAMTFLFPPFFFGINPLVSPAFVDTGASRLTTVPSFPFVSACGSVIIWPVAWLGTLDRVYHATPIQ